MNDNPNYSPELAGIASHIKADILLKMARQHKPDKPIDFSDWICKYTNLNRKPFSFAKHEYQREIVADTHPKQVIKKSVQLGISEILIRKQIAFLCMYPGTQSIYTFPTAEEVGIFVKTRIDPAIKECPKIQELGFNVDNVKIKQIGRSFAYYRGSFGEKETIAVPSDLNCFEESTEILTRVGWKGIEILTEEDIVATRNKDGFLEWHNPYFLIKKYYEGELLIFKHKRLKLTVTPEHKMLVRKFSSVNIKKNIKPEDFTFKEAQNLLNNPCFIMTSDCRAQEENKVSFEIKNQRIIKRPQGSSLLSPSCVQPWP